MPTDVPLYLAHQVAEAGGIAAWTEQHPDVQSMARFLDGMCQARTVDDVLLEVSAIMNIGHLIWAYAYMSVLLVRDVDLFYGALLKASSELLPVVYTPTVGEVRANGAVERRGEGRRPKPSLAPSSAQACQKLGLLPVNPRGCFISLRYRGRIVDVLRDYAKRHLQQRGDGTYDCQCIVFSDGGRILGLGDLGAWGFGIPQGKLSLYVAAGGVDPNKTIPVIIDAGISDANTAGLKIREHPNYTGLKQQRKMQKSPAGTMVNTAYYGPNSLITEFMDAAVTVFGRNVLLQFEDFNSNDAFPLLDATRDRYLTYNDDIQGTAAVTVAGILGALKLRAPNADNLREALSQEIFLFHGAGSANIGAATLLVRSAGVDQSQIFMTNSRGLIWKEADGSQGSFRNEEQKSMAVVGKPNFPHSKLEDIVAHLAPTVLVGAVGVAPGCFTKQVVEAMVAASVEKAESGAADIMSMCLPTRQPKPRASTATAAGKRPVIFALSNPKTQAEITAEDAYTWSKGAAIFGSGTLFAPVTVNGRLFKPGQGVCARARAPNRGASRHPVTDAPVSVVCRARCQ